MRRQWLYKQAMFCICKISQDWMQRNLLAKHSKSLDDIAMEKQSRILWCFVASHPQYCQYIFPFPDLSKNFFSIRAVQLVHTAECRHNAEEYKPQIVCWTVVRNTEYEIKLLTHKKHPISRPWGRAMVYLLWEDWPRCDGIVLYFVVDIAVRRIFNYTFITCIHVHTFIYMHTYTCACACTYTLTYICIFGCNLTGKGKHFLLIVSCRLLTGRGKDIINICVVRRSLLRHDAARIETTGNKN